MKTYQLEYVKTEVITIEIQGENFSDAMYQSEKLTPAGYQLNQIYNEQSDENRKITYK